MAHAVHMLNYDDIPDKMGRIHQASLCPPGPKELGEYLLKLDKDDDLYNQYFQVNWKYTGKLQAKSETAS